MSHVLQRAALIAEIEQICDGGQVLDAPEDLESLREFRDALLDGRAPRPQDFDEEGA